MRIFSILLLTLVFITACNKEKTNRNLEDCFKTENTYSFKDKAKVDTGRNIQFFYATVNAGNKLVFKYNSSTYATCPGIVDGGSSYSLIFEVDPNITSFTYHTVDMQNANVYSSVSCGECSIESQNAAAPESGIISGTRLSANSWQISFDVQTKFHGHRTGSAVFTKE